MKSVEEQIAELERKPPIFPRLRDELRTIPGVIDLGIGMCRRGGLYSGEVGFIAYVGDKRPLADIPPAERLPREIEGVPVDVVIPDAGVPLGIGGRVSVLGGGVRVTGEGGRYVMQRDDGTRIIETGEGTLGWFGRQESDQSKLVMLTCCHVLYDGLGEFGAGEHVGQPDTTSHCSRCCETGDVGDAIKGLRDNLVDCGITSIRNRPVALRIPGLDADVNGRNRELVVGPVPQPRDLCGYLTFVVPNERVKFVGATTRLSHGRIVSICAVVGSMIDQIAIAPEGDPEVRYDGMLTFAQPGDSGSVVLNRFNQVVGLLHSMVTPPRPSIPGVILGAYACHIHLVAQALDISIEASPDADHTLAPDTATDDPTWTGAPYPCPPCPTTMLVPGRPIERRRMTPTDLVRRRVLSAVIADLDAHPFGAELVRLVRLHRADIEHLLDHDRKFKVTWHRAGGPELVARLLHGLESIDQPIPRDIKGVSVATILDRLADVVIERGNDDLRTVVERLRGVAAALLPECTSIRALLDGVRRHGEARP